MLGWADVELADDGRLDGLDSGPYIVVRQVTGVTLAAAFLFGGEFFAPYGSVIGQVILAALIAAYLGSLAVMRRRARQRPRERILVGVHR